MKRFLSLVGFLLFFASFIHAQTGKISGYVTEADKRGPVQNAVVKITPLNLQSVTNAEGYFEIKDVPYGSYTVTVNSDKYEIFTTTIELKSASAAIPSISLVKKSGETESVSEISSILLDQEDESKDQNISGLLHSSEDVFTRTAGYIFGSMYFQPRGYNSEDRTILINGSDVGDAETGRTSFGDWGGLNDAMHNKETYNYTEPTPISYGSIGGVTNIDTRASNIRKQIKISYSLTDRSYRNRIMATYSTGLMKNGWAFAVSGSRRWSQEGYVEGTWYDAWGYFLAAEKKFRKQSIALTIFAAPTTRASASASMQDAYDLAGTNYYNPNWGYQNGQKRNARIKTSNMPEILLNHNWNINEKTKLNSSINYTFGKSGWTSLNWYNAPDPRPDYYRNLPRYQAAAADSAYVAEQWKNDVNVRQINWDNLYYINRLDNQQGKQASYIVENNVTKTNQILFNTNVNSEVNSNVNLTGGLNLKVYKAEHYKILDDLLGGKYWVNIDQFAQRDFPGDSASAQLNLKNPNQIIYQGDKFGYDYDVHYNDINLWGQSKFSYNKIDFYLAASLTGVEFWRTGHYQNGRFPEASYGDSKICEFMNYGIKGGLTYKISGRQYITVNGFDQTQAPYFVDTFIAPKTRNSTIDNPVNEKMFGGDINYIIRYPWLNARLTYYYTQFLDEANIISFYDDDLSTYVNYSMSGINKTHQGIEFGAEIKATKSLSFVAVAAVGQYLYTSRPTTIISYDNGSAPNDTSTTYIKNFYVPSTPQTALTGGIKLNYKYWFLNVDANYYDNMYLDFNPERRTLQAVSTLGPGDPLIQTITQEQKMKGGFTLDAALSKSIRINYKYFINVSLSVSNILNNMNIQNGGYEQNRFDFTTLDVNKYQPKLYYYYGRTYFLNITFRM
jgi:hypothetical protein